MSTHSNRSLINPPVTFATQSKYLRSEFECVFDSFFCGEMLVSCGHSNTFKITSGIFGSLTLCWKLGIEWQTMEDASLKEAEGVTRGLRVEGGVPLKELKIDIDLPLFNSGTSHKRRTSKDYFVKSKEQGITPYEYAPDVVRRGLTLTNTLPITDNVKHDVEKYTQEQSNIPESLPQTAEQKLNEEVNRKDREDAIKAAIRKYDNDLEVLTAARKHQLNGYSTLER